MKLFLSVACLLAFAGCSQAGGLSPFSSATAHVLRDGARANAGYHTIHSFAGPSSDGANPPAHLIAMGDTLYGTTWAGGADNNGAVFSVTRGKEALTYSFKGGSADGSNPAAPLVDVNGTLYGTTYNGGTHGNGTVFKVSTSGTETLLHSFGTSDDGQNPQGGLVNLNGTLYGTTVNGGAFSGCGTVFKITTSGKEQVLHSFCETSSDASHPVSPLVAVNGVLYGTTVNGPGSSCYRSGCGTIFSMTTAGKERVIYQFKGSPDGDDPQAGLTLVNGTLYGTTEQDGAHGDGTVFAVTTSGKERTIYSFKGSADGANPEAGLIEVNLALYGTTYKGGTSDEGTVFSVTTTGKEKVLYNFLGYPDGQYPEAGLFYLNGALFGTTYGGGTAGYGTVFSLKP